MLENEELYLDFLNGDENALRELIERHGDSLTAYINGYTKNVNEAEDLMIETFARIVAKRPHIRKQNFKPYLYKVGRNLALRYMAKKRVFHSFSLEEIDGETASNLFVDDALQSDERDRILHLSLGQLPPDYKEVLYLLYFENLSYKEAAEIMKKTEKQIANLVCRGKLALRPILEKEGMTNAKY